jgi:hypothetical protein
MRWSGTGKFTKTLWILGVFFILVALPQSAFADAGTPLMWATMLHLVIGNAIIGVVEGLALAKLFSLKKLKTVALLIPANYFSAWVGGLFLENAIVRHLHMDLNNAWKWFWILVVATYLMTLVLEWPFVALCFRGSAGWFRRSLKGNLVIQTMSYVLVFGWYWMASGTSLYTKMQIVSSRELSLPESVIVYFISEPDGNVYARNPSGIENRRVFELHSTNENDRLFARQSSTHTNYWDLVARIETDNLQDPRFVEVQKDITKQAVSDWRATQNPPTNEGTWFEFGDVPRLGSAEKSDWDFETGFWPIEGLHGTNAVKHTRVYFSFETPFGAWNVRNATHLPGDKVLFQLGENQICIFDPDAKKVALLTHGRGPVAIIVEKTNEPAATLGSQKR